MVSIGPEGHHGYPSRDARPLASGRLYGYSGQTHRTGLALAERLCRTANRIDSARVSRSFRGLGRSTSAPDSAILHSLLQQHQNAPIIGQRCARLSSRSADRINKFIPGPWWASSPLSAGFKFSVQTASINSSSLARLMCVESCKCRARSAVGPRASPARRIRSAAVLEILGIDRSFASRRTATASDDQGAGTECARSSGRNRGPVFAEIF